MYIFFKHNKTKRLNVTRDNKHAGCTHYTVATITFASTMSGTSLKDTNWASILGVCGCVLAVVVASVLWVPVHDSKNFHDSYTYALRNSAGGAILTSNGDGTAQWTKARGAFTVLCVCICVHKLTVAVVMMLQRTWCA